MFCQFVTAALQVSTAEKAEASPSAQDFCHGLAACHWLTQNITTLQVQTVDKLPDCPKQFRTHICTLLQACSLTNVGSNRHSPYISFLSALLTKGIRGLCRQLGLATFKASPTPERVKGKKVDHFFSRLKKSCSSHFRAVATGSHHLCRKWTLARGVAFFEETVGHNLSNWPLFEE